MVLFPSDTQSAIAWCLLEEECMKAIVPRLRHDFRSITCIFVGLLLANPSLAQQVDSSTLKGKVLVGYQGWFRCAGDGSSEDGWYHWFHSAKDEPTTAEISDPATRT